MGNGPPVQKATEGFIVLFVVVLHEILNDIENLSTRLLELPLNNLLLDKHTELLLKLIQVVPAFKERL